MFSTGSEGVYIFKSATNYLFVADGVVVDPNEIGGFEGAATERNGATLESGIENAHNRPDFNYENNVSAKSRKKKRKKAKIADTATKDAAPSLRNDTDDAQSAPRTTSLRRPTFRENIHTNDQAAPTTAPAVLQPIASVVPLAPSTRYAQPTNPFENVSAGHPATALATPSVLQPISPVAPITPNSPATPSDDPFERFRTDRQLAPIVEILLELAQVDDHLIQQVVGQMKSNKQINMNNLAAVSGENEDKLWTFFKQGSYITDNKKKCKHRSDLSTNPEKNKRIMERTNVIWYEDTFPCDVPFYDQKGKKDDPLSYFSSTYGGKRSKTRPGIVVRHDEHGAYAQPGFTHNEVGNAGLHEDVQNREIPLANLEGLEGSNAKLPDNAVYMHGYRASPVASIEIQTIFIPWNTPMKPGRAGWSRKARRCC